jgi:hypothetical protein
VEGIFDNCVLQISTISIPKFKVYIIFRKLNYVKFDQFFIYHFHHNIMYTVHDCAAADQLVVVRYFAGNQHKLLTILRCNSG